MPNKKKGKAKKRTVVTDKERIIQQIQTCNPTSNNPIIQMSEASGQLEEPSSIELMLDFYEDLSSIAASPWFQFCVDPLKLPGFGDQQTTRLYLGPQYLSTTIHVLPKFMTDTNYAFMVLTGVPAYPTGIGHPSPEVDKYDDLDFTYLYQQQRRFINPQVSQNWYHVATINYLELQHAQQQLGQVNYVYTDGTTKVQLRLHCLFSLSIVHPETGLGYAASFRFRIRLKYRLPIYLSNRVSYIKKANKSPTGNVNTANNTTGPTEKLVFPVLIGVHKP